MESKSGKDRPQRSEQSPTPDSVSDSSPTTAPDQEHAGPPTAGDFRPSTFEAHAAIIGDPRVSKPAHARQRGMFARQLQRSYGNQYVQRLAEANRPAQALIAQTLQRDDDGNGGQQVMVAGPSAPAPQPPSPQLVAQAQQAFSRVTTRLDQSRQSYSQTGLMLTDLIALGKDLTGKVPGSVGDAPKTAQDAISRIESGRDELDALVGQIDPVVSAVTVQRPTAENATSEQLIGILRELIQGDEVLTALDYHVAVTNEEIVQSAKTMAIAAGRLGDMELSKNIAELADQAHATVAPPGRRVLDNLRLEDLSVAAVPGDRVKPHGNDEAAEGYLPFDVGSNVVAGLFAGVLGALHESGFVNMATSAGTVFGAMTGAIGGVFGLIGFSLALRAAISSKTKAKELQKMVPYLSDANAKEIAEYAASQKKSKADTSTALAVLGGAAVVAGGLGMAAAFVSTLGLAAVVVGLTVAATSLLVPVFKYFSQKREKAREREAFAEGLVDAVRAGGPAAASAQQTIGRFGLDPAAASGNRRERAALVQQLADKVKDKQRQSAEALVTLFMEGKPSQQVEATLILERLGVNTKKLKERYSEGERETAVNRAERKLSAW